MSWPDGRHLFALQKLFLRFAEIFVGAAGFFVEPDFFDGGGELAADGDQQVFVVAGIFVAQLVAQAHDADWIVFAPEKDPDPGAVGVGAQELGDLGRQVREIFGGHDFGARAHDQIAKALGEADFGGTHFVAAARAPGGAAAISCGVGIGEVDGPALGAEQRDYLAQGEVENLVEIERLRGHHGHGVERVEFAVAAPHFLFGAALLGHVEHESLVALDFSRGVALWRSCFRPREGASRLCGGV